MEILAAEAQLQILMRGSGFFVGVPIEPAPYAEDRAYPAIVYKLLTPEPDLVIVGGIRVMSTLDYLVAVTGPGENLAAYVDYVRYIDLALEGKGGTNSYGTVFGITRIRPYSQPYHSQSGKLMQQAGSTYRIQAKGAAS